MKKKFFVFAMVAVMVLSTAVLASADELEELIAAAKKEGKVVVYSVTSRIHLAAEAFQEKYGIEVEEHRLSEVELVERVYQEARAGVNAVDLVLIEDYPSIKELLIQPGYLTNYVPPAARDAVDEQYHDPLVFAYISRITGYNTEVYPEDPFDSIWDLTTPEFRGRVMIRDVAITGEHQNALTELIRRSDEIEAEYERRFGEKLVLREENAGLEFLRRLVENDLILMTSDTRISEAVGKKGQEDPPFGFYYVYSKHRDIPNKDLALDVSTNIKPFLGYYYGMYVQLATKANNPNAAKLFANYLMTPEGYEPWSSEVGFYSMNKNVEPHPDDMPWEWWKERLWTYDPDFAIANRGKVLDTWIRSVVQ
ncbi:MAG: extracellular solute-binding protein [Firmicutes bacterium]|nr:extracellular solute-binding protein [Bacillota bacterium]